MSSYPDREPLSPDAVVQIAQMEPDEGIDVMLHYFLSLLGGMELQAARKMRDELSNRFGGRHCNQRLCTMMVEMLNGHLGLDQRPTSL
jgi:hypothetical protein